MMLADVTNIPALFAKNPDWQADFDQDGAVKQASRHRMFDRVVADNLSVTGYYYGMPGARTIKKDGKGYAFVPVKAA